MVLQNKENNKNKENKPKTEILLWISRIRIISVFQLKDKKEKLLFSCTQLGQVWVQVSSFWRWVQAFHFLSKCSTVRLPYKRVQGTNPCSLDLHCNDRKAKRDRIWAILCIPQLLLDSYLPLRQEHCLALLEVIALCSQHIHVDRYQFIESNNFWFYNRMFLDSRTYDSGTHRIIQYPKL